MSKEVRIMCLENRISKLSVNPENAKIVNKLKRQLRALKG